MIGTIILFIGACLTLIFFVVAKPNKVATDFIIDLEDGKMLEAYALTSQDFQQKTSQTDFVLGVNQIAKNDPIQAFTLHESKVQNTIATITGILTTQKGTRSLTLQLIEEKGLWKIRTFNTGKLVKNTP